MIENKQRLSNSKESTLVSVIIPSFNQGKFLPCSIDSILGQTYKNFEIIVIDGLSTDNTIKVLNSYNTEKLKWISEKDNGVVEAVNKGFRMAIGNILSIQSSDDMYADKHVFEEVVNIFDSDVSIGLVYGNTKKIDVTGNTLNVSNFSEFSIENLLCKKTRIPQESSFFLKSLIELAGVWNEDVSYAADTDFFLRISQITKVVRVNKILGIRRMHTNQRDKNSTLIVLHYNKTIDNFIRSKPFNIKRAGIAGKCLTFLRYNPKNSELLKSLSLLSAKLIWPKSVNIKKVDRRYLIPGLIPILKLLSNLKKHLFSNG